MVQYKAKLPTPVGLSRAPAVSDQLLVALSCAISHLQFLYFMPLPSVPTAHPSYLNLFNSLRTLDGMPAKNGQELNKYGPDLTKVEKTRENSELTDALEQRQRT
jgi:hypothetical protein